MAVCERCGKKFDLDDAKDEFDEYFSSWEEDAVTYDEVVDNCYCAECAINETRNGISGWNAMPDEFHEWAAYDE